MRSTRNNWTQTQARGWIQLEAFVLAPTRLHKTQEEFRIKNENFFLSFLWDLYNTSNTKPSALENVVCLRWEDDVAPFIETEFRVSVDGAAELRRKWKNKMVGLKS